MSIKKRVLLIWSLRSDSQKELVNTLIGEYDGDIDFTHISELTLETWSRIKDEGYLATLDLVMCRYYHSSPENAESRELLNQIYSIDSVKPKLVIVHQLTDAEDRLLGQEFPVTMFPHNRCADFFNRYLSGNA